MKITQDTQCLNFETFFRSNQDTCLSQRPLRNQGQWISKGQLLADSINSVSGDLALGKNVLVAYMPWEGYNFEDSIVISDRLISDDVYTSIHVLRFRTEVVNNLSAYALGKKTSNKTYLPYEYFSMDTWFKSIICRSRLTAKHKFFKKSSFLGNLFSQSRMIELTPAWSSASLSCIPHSFISSQNYNFYFSIKQKHLLRFTNLKLRYRFGSSAALSKLATRVTAAKQHTFGPTFDQVTLAKLKGKGIFRFTESNFAPTIEGSVSALQSTTSGPEGGALQCTAKNRKQTIKVKNSAISCVTSGLPVSTIRSNQLIKIRPNVMQAAPCLPDSYIPRIHAYNFYPKFIINNTFRFYNANQTTYKKHIIETPKGTKDGLFVSVFGAIRFAKVNKNSMQSEKISFTSCFDSATAEGKPQICLQKKLKLNTLPFFVKRNPVPRNKQVNANLTKKNFLSKKSLKSSSKIQFSPAQHRKLNESRHANNVETRTSNIPFLGDHLLSHLDQNGIAKVGTWVSSGDILVGKVRPLANKIKSNKASTQLAWEIISNKKNESINVEDKSFRLPKGVSGRVIRTEILPHSSSEQIHVYLAVKRKVQVGDKLAGRHGNKGIVSLILPKQDMPYLADGTPIDVILSPLGVPSRMNVGQIYECLLGLAAKSLVCHFKIDNSMATLSKRQLKIQSLKEFHANFKNKVLEPKKNNAYKNDYVSCYGARNKSLICHTFGPVPKLVTKIKTRGKLKGKSITPGPEGIARSSFVPTTKSKYIVKKNKKIYNQSFNQQYIDLKDKNLVNWTSAVSTDCFFNIYAKQLNASFVNLTNIIKNKNKGLTKKQISDKHTFHKSTILTKGSTAVLNPTLIKHKKQFFCMQSKKNTASTRCFAAQSNACFENYYKSSALLVAEHCLCNRSSFAPQRGGEATVALASTLYLPSVDADRRLKIHFLRSRNFGRPSYFAPSTLECFYLRSSVAEHPKVKALPVVEAKHPKAKPKVETKETSNFSPCFDNATAKGKPLSKKLISTFSPVTPSELALHSKIKDLYKLEITKKIKMFKQNKQLIFYSSLQARNLVFLKLYHSRITCNKKWLFSATNPGKVKLFDGRTGQPFSSWVTVGYAYMLKLIHLVDNKIHSRSTGPYSLITRQPVTGKARQGGQRIGEMEAWAIEGFGAAYTLQEFFSFKGDDVSSRHQWQITTLSKLVGNTTAFKTFLSELRALCISIEFTGFTEEL